MALVRSRRARPVAAPLAFDWRAACPAPPFSIGVPFPWDAAPDSDFDGEPPVLELVARRSDGLAPSLALWFDTDGPEVVSADARPLVQEIVVGEQAKWFGVWRVMLGGARGDVHVFLSPSQVLLQPLVNYGNGLLQGQFRLPRTAALAYLPHVETMLGTWDWGR